MLVMEPLGWGAFGRRLRGERRRAEIGIKLITRLNRIRVGRFFLHGDNRHSMLMLMLSLAGLTLAVCWSWIRFFVSANHRLLVGGTFVHAFKLDVL